MEAPRVEADFHEIMPMKQIALLFAFAVTGLHAQDWAGQEKAGINTESAYDWTADQWSVPINLQLSQVLKIDKQLVSVGVGGRYYAVTPNNGPNWGCRLTVTFLFPEGQH